VTVVPGTVLDGLAPVITGGGSGAGAGLPCWLVVMPSERPELT